MGCRYSVLYLILTFNLNLQYSSVHTIINYVFIEGLCRVEHSIQTSCEVYKTIVQGHDADDFKSRRKLNDRAMKKHRIYGCTFPYQTFGDKISTVALSRVEVVIGDGDEARQVSRGWPGLSFSSAGAGASDTSRRPRSLAMWPSLRSAVAQCAAAHSPAARWSASCPGQPASPCYSMTLNLQNWSTL